MKNSAFVFVFGMFSMLILVFAFNYFGIEVEKTEASPEEKAASQEKKDEEEFAFLEEYERTEVKVVDACRFDKDLLPPNLSVYMVYAEGDVGKPLKYPMDASGGQARQIDVQVHLFKQSVGLVLAANLPTIWNVSWTEHTAIGAVYLSGDHRQEVVGLHDSVPVIRATAHAQTGCKPFRYRPPLGVPAGLSSEDLPDDAIARIERVQAKVAGENKAELAYLAQGVFGTHLSEIFMVKGDTAVIGRNVPQDAKFLHFPGKKADDFLDKDRPRAGKQGIEELLMQGKIRKATQRDYVRWANEMYEKHKHRLSPTVPPFDHVELFWPDRPRIGYVILEKTSIPGELRGPHLPLFFLEKGVPFPEVPVHEHEGEAKSLVNIFDFNTLTCEGLRCSLGNTIYSDIQAFEKQPDEGETPWSCGLGAAAFPDDVVVVAAGAYTGKYGKFDVRVNLPGYPVALILGAHEKAEWNISWTEGTQIVAAYVMGQETQIAKGLSVKTLVSYSGAQQEGSCEHFNVSPSHLFKINKLSQTIFKKNASRVYFAQEGYIHIGAPASADTVFYSRKD